MTRKSTALVLATVVGVSAAGIWAISQHVARQPGQASLPHSEPNSINPAVRTSSNTADIDATLVDKRMLSLPADHADLTIKGLKSDSQETDPAKTLQECVSAGEAAASINGTNVTTQCKGPNPATIETTSDVAGMLHSVFTKLPKLSAVDNAPQTPPAAPTPAAPLPAAAQEPTEEQLKLLAIAPQNGPFVVDVGTAGNGFARPFTVNTLEEGVRYANAALRKPDVHGHVLYQISDRSQSEPVPVLDGECTPKGCTANLDRAHDITKFWKDDAEMQTAIQNSRLTIKHLALKP